MRRDLTNEEVGAALDFAVDENNPIGDCLAVAISIHFRRPDSGRTPELTWHLMEAIRCFVKDGGEMHLVEKGKEHGKVRAVRCDG